MLFSHDGVGGAYAAEGGAREPDCGIPKAVPHQSEIDGGERESESETHERDIVTLEEERESDSKIRERTLERERERERFQN